MDGGTLPEGRALRALRRHRAVAQPGGERGELRDGASDGGGAGAGRG